MSCGRSPAAGWRACATPRSRHTEESRLGWYLILGTAPIAVLGLAFKDTIEHEFRTLELIGVAMVLFSVVLLEAERRGRRRRSLEDFTLRDGVLIGCAQALALVPGVSRSGATISAGLLLDFDRTTAARYSFLLSVPAVVLSGLFELRHVGDGGGAPAGATALATLLAFVVGYATIAWLLRWVTRHGIGIFAAYRMVVGVLVAPARLAVERHQLSRSRARREAGQRLEQRAPRSG